jgi:peptidoglycan/xylan/chitin deacetylase (PgdA/CDA1 family)
MGLRSLSIIQYQNVTTRDGIYKLWLSLAAFKKQMDYLAENPFRILSIDDAVRYMRRALGTASHRAVSLTFDNGFADFFNEAFPVLAEYGFPATVLISPDKIGRQTTLGGETVDYLSWDHLRELSAAGVTMGAYEDEHWNINRIPRERVRDHIRTYKHRLEDGLGAEVSYFGVKEGVPSPEMRDLLVETGYRAFLTQCPTNRRTDLYAIGRIQVDDEDFNIFLTKISKTYLFFKDKRSWRYIREYKLDKLVHRVSEAYNRFRQN